MSDNSKVGQFVVISATVPRAYNSSIGKAVDHILWCLKEWPRTYRQKKLYVVQIVREVTPGHAAYVTDGKHEDVYLAAKEQAPKCNCWHCNK